MSGYVDFHYMPLEGKITGKQVLKQTEDALNDLGNHLYDLDIDESRIDEAVEKSEQAIETAESALSAVTTDRSVWKNTVADMKATDIEAGVTAATRGENLYNDGNGAFYVVRQEKSGDIDGEDTVFLDNGNIAERLKQFNFIAKGNNIIYVESVDALKESDAIIGNVYGTNGYHFSNDGGSSLYSIRAKDASDVDDGGSIIFLDNGKVAELIIEDSIVNVRQFGAYGDGTHEDTDAVNKAALFAAKKHLYFPSGNYLCGELLFSYNENDYGERNAPRIISGVGLASRIVAKAGTTLLIDLSKTTNRILKDLWLVGNGEDGCTLLDTHYHLAAPSVQNKYINIRLSNPGELGWDAQSNNDCTFDNIVCEGGVGNDCIYINALSSGGYVTFDRCYAFKHRFAVAGQNITVTNCAIGGIEINGSDWNCLTIIGGYLYADSTNHKNIAIKNNVSVQNITAIGAHIENDYADGSIVGGTGALVGTAKFLGGHIFNTQSATIPLLDANLGSSGGGIVKCENVYLSYISMDPVGSLYVEYENCNFNGTRKSSVLRIEDYGNGVYSEKTNTALSLYNTSVMRGLVIGTKTLNLVADVPQEIVDPINNASLILGAGLLFISHTFSKSTANLGIYAIAKNDYNQPVITPIVNGTKLSGQYSFTWTNTNGLFITSTQNCNVKYSLIWI